MRYAVVTGVTKGIGRAVAERLLQRDFFVIGNYASVDSAAKAFLQDNEKYAQRLLVLKHELSSYETACVFAERIMSVSQTIDVLILNND